MTTLQYVSFTYANLEEAYQDCCIGSDHPTDMLVGRKVFPYLLDRLPFLGLDRYKNGRWNNAFIQESSEVGDNEIRFVNAHKPKDSRRNRTLYFNFNESGIVI